MFEEDAKNYAIGLTYPKFQDNQVANIVLRDVEGAFQKGAEFGYNKANEWHYPSKGELPKASGNYILAFYGAEGSVASGKPCCEEIYFDAELLRWKERDTCDDLPYLEKKGVVIAWRELPEPPKEEE
jgi:hypothetical protein